MDMSSSLALMTLLSPNGISTQVKEIIFSGDTLMLFGPSPTISTRSTRGPRTGLSGNGILGSARLAPVFSTATLNVYGPSIPRAAQFSLVLMIKQRGDGVSRLARVFVLMRATPVPSLQWLSMNQVNGSSRAHLTTQLRSGM